MDRSRNGVAGVSRRPEMKEGHRRGELRRRRASARLGHGDGRRRAGAEEGALPAGGADEGRRRNEETLRDHRVGFVGAGAPVQTVKSFEVPTWSPWMSYRIEEDEEQRRIGACGLGWAER